MEPTVDLGSLLAELEAPDPQSPDFIPWLSQVLQMDPRLVASLARDNPEQIAILLDRLGTPAPPDATTATPSTTAPSSGLGTLLGTGLPGIMGTGTAPTPTPTPTVAPSVIHPPNPTIGAPEASVAPTAATEPMLGDTRFTQPAEPTETAPEGPTAASKLGALLTGLQGIEAPPAPQGQTIDTPAAPRPSGTISSGGLGALLTAIVGQRRPEETLRLAQALRR